MFAGVRRLLFDLSGTLHIENEIIPGALEALAAAKSAGLQVDFVSNTSKEGRADLLSRLSRLSVPVEPQHLYTSLSVTASAVESRRLRPLLLLTKSAAADFPEPAPPHPCPGDDSQLDSVVVGLASERLNYSDLNRAMRILIDKPGAPLLATHRSRYLRGGDGRLHIGPGAFVAALEFATGCRAEVFGKPSDSFFKSVLGPADSSDPSCAVMIGDDAIDDAAGAARCGLRSVLVRTGKFRPGDEAQTADSGAPSPTAVCADALEAVRLILRDRR